ncbi:MAG: hypothetical protein JST90_00125 [Bacteroidetes bacterium]|nr:hypothetical protein [Bacteroidota bacterium]
MTNIAYLMGAGASAQAIPVVNKLNSRLNIFLQFLLNSGQTHSALVNDLKKLIKDEKIHFSIDTYARKLYFQNNTDDYKKLKVLLACFFLFEQLNKDANVRDWVEDIREQESVSLQVDKRYDSFFASVLELRDGKIKMPNNINVVSWNYDNQYEISLNQFLSGDWSSDPMRFVSHPSDEICPSDSTLTRLNGEAYYHKYIREHLGNIYNRLNYDIPLTRESSSAFVLLYETLRKEECPLLNFAWDTDNVYTDNRVTNARERFSKAEVIVIIGYSFPYYNVKIDQAIFSKISHPTIYIQAPKDSTEAIESRLHYVLPASVKIKAKIVNTVDQFFLPPDFFGISGKTTYSI